MDLVQETITLLELRLQSIRRQVGPLRKYRAGRNCQKGYNCGGSCITRRKNCRKALKGEAKNFSDWMVQKMSANIGAAVGDAPADVKRTPDGKPTSDINAYDMRAKGFDARKDKIVRKEDGGTYAVSSSGAFPDTLIEHDGVDARFKGGVRQSTDKRLKEAKRENAKDPYMSKEGAAERAAYIDEELKRRDDQRNAAKASNQKVLDDMEAKARQQREDQGLGKAKAEPKPEPKPQTGNASGTMGLSVTQADQGIEAKKAELQNAKSAKDKKRLRDEIAQAEIEKEDLELFAINEFDRNNPKGPKAVLAKVKEMQANGATKEQVLDALDAESKALRAEMMSNASPEIKATMQSSDKQTREYIKSAQADIDRLTKVKNNQSSAAEKAATQKRINAIESLKKADEEIVRKGEEQLWRDSELSRINKARTRRKGKTKAGSAG